MIGEGAGCSHNPPSSAASGPAGLGASPARRHRGARRPSDRSPACLTPPQQGVIERAVQTTANILPLDINPSLAWAFVALALAIYLSAIWVGLTRNK